MVGDKIEAVTKAIGIKPCSGCKERKELLNNVSKGRRGFLQSAAIGVVAFSLGAKTIKAQAAVANDRTAVEVLRLLNTAQNWHKAETGKFVDLEELFSSPAMGRIKAKKWASLIASLNLKDSEVIPGWELQHVTDGNTYSITIKTVESTTYKFSTNDSGVIDLGQPIQVKGWVAGLFFRCTGPFGEPGCCCMYACCNLCHCCLTNNGRCFNCGCQCCVWCETDC
jgi:hypothetical protein